MKKKIFFILLFLSLSLLSFYLKISNTYGRDFYNYGFLKILFQKGTLAGLLRDSTLWPFVWTILLYLLGSYKTLSKNTYPFFLTLVAVYTIFYGLLDFCDKYKVIKYLWNFNDVSTFYEDHYVDPRKATIKAPRQKQNLILIYLESMEGTFSKKNLIGSDLIPHLTRLASENLSFSTYINGYSQHWTMGALVGTMSGLPLQYIFDAGIDANLTGNMLKTFLPKAYSLGQILQDNGYETLFVQGGSISFSGTDVFLNSHGFKENVYGLENLKEEDLQEAPSWWGARDKDTYGIFKEKLSNLPKDKPFFAVLMTLDTHQGEYVDPEAPRIFQENSKNIIYHASFQANELVNWIKKQPYAKKTTIILIGDHLRPAGIGSGFVEEVKPRTIYNAFMNIRIPLPENRNRTFDQTDMFPTILESLGFEIEGRKLGLGTSLFSEEETLTERFGQDRLDELLGKRNKMYLDFWKEP